MADAKKTGVHTNDGRRVIPLIPPNDVQTGRQTVVPVKIVPTPPTPTPPKKK
jgi:hypothetical protein